MGTVLHLGTAVLDETNRRAKGVCVSVARSMSSSTPEDDGARDRDERPQPQSDPPREAAQDGSSRFGIEQVAGVVVAVIGLVLLPIVPWFVFSRGPHPAPPTATPAPVAEQPVATTPTTPATIKQKARPRPPAPKVTPTTAAPVVTAPPPTQPVVSQPQYTSPPQTAAPAPPAPVVSAPPVAPVTTPVTVPIVVPVTPTTGIPVPLGSSHG